MARYGLRISVGQVRVGIRIVRLICIPFVLQLLASKNAARSDRLRPRRPSGAVSSKNSIFDTVLENFSY